MSALITASRIEVTVAPYSPKEGQRITQLQYLSLAHIAQPERLGKANFVELR